MLNQIVKSLGVIIKRFQDLTPIIRKKKVIPNNFDANFYKPSCFPYSDNIWEKEKYWITMICKSKRLGLKFEN
jgi:hypothetical protein